MSTTPGPKASEILEDVQSYIKSRANAAVGVIGKAAMFDTKAHNNIDYTANGLLEKRWVNNDPTSIAKRKQQGFALPRDISGHFENLEMKNQILMLIPKETRANLVAQVEQKTRRYEGAVFSKDSRSVRGKDGGVMEGFEVTQDGAPTTPTNALVAAPSGPAANPKKAISAK